jgi:membrane-associated protease RseP (regulator of RpoE activity)
VSFALGVVLFAVCIGISIALHEAGHMWTAKAFGMKVRRYFIGFGPKIFSFHRGETEYGMKWIPAGGFCDIAGMTALDPVTEDEAPRAFFTRKTWQRVVVLSAGSMMHFLVGIVVLYVMAVSTMLPPAVPPAIAGGTACLPATQNPVTLDLSPCDSKLPSPAQRAGIRPGDQIVSVGGAPTPTWTEALNAIRVHAGPTPFGLVRNGRQLTVMVDVATVQRTDVNAQKGQANALEPAGAIGLQIQQVLPVHYGPLQAVPATFVFTGYMFEATWQGIKMFPDKVPTVLRAIAGHPRDQDSPMSVVGASIIGGDAAEQGQWSFFLLLLAALNFFVGVFNLAPLLPLDGGHIAVNLYERVRDIIRKRAGKPKMPPVDYTRLLPVTYAFILIFGAISLLTITADIVNPIRFQ